MSRDSHMLSLHHILRIHMGVAVAEWWLEHAHFSWSVFVGGLFLVFVFDGGVLSIFQHTFLLFSLVHTKTEVAVPAKHYVS